MSDMGQQVQSNDGVCYYCVLGIFKKATDHEIRGAYRKMALKWHPDRWSRDPKVAVEAKRRYQQIQEAYSVLSNKGKTTIYDAGLFGLIGEDDDEGFVKFMQEMVLMMQRVSPQDEKDRLEDLEGLLMDMMRESEELGKSVFNWNSCTVPTKKTRV